MIETISCPTCGASTQVLTIGLSDHTTCPNGHPVDWHRQPLANDYRIVALGKLEESIRCADEAEAALRAGKPVDGEDIWAFKKSAREAIEALEKFIGGRVSSEQS